MLKFSFLRLANLWNAFEWLNGENFVRKALWKKVTRKPHFPKIKVISRLYLFSLICLFRIYHHCPFVIYQVAHAPLIFYLNEKPHEKHEKRSLQWNKPMKPAENIHQWQDITIRFAIIFHNLWPHVN